MSKLGKYCCIVLLVGIVIGGLAGVFIGRKTVTKPERKTSMTIEEVFSAKAPKKYHRSVYFEDLLFCEEEKQYEKNIKSDSIIFELSKDDLSDIYVKNSGIEDGMIYTLCGGTRKDGVEYEVLFINEPYTQEFVAASYTVNDYKGYSHYLFDNYIDK